jgi:hydrogenase-4 component B
MLVLATACIGLGVFPGMVLGPARVVVDFVLTSLAPGVEYAAPPLADGLWAPGTLLGLLIAVGGMVWSVRHWTDPLRKARSGLTWSCAYPAPTPRMQYTADSFSGPLRLAFGVASRPARKGAGIGDGKAGDRVLAGLNRLWHQARSVAALLRPIQQQPITRYLQYIVLTVLLLLGALFASLMRR